MRRFKNMTAALILATALTLSPVATLPTNNTLTVYAATKTLSKMTAQEIANKLKSAGFPIKNIINYTSKTDPNGLLGKTNQYTSKVNFADTRLSQYSSSDPAGGSIEVFKTKSDATKRKKYIESIMSGVSFLKEYIYQYDNVLLRLDYDLTSSQVKVYKTAFSNMKSGKAPTYPVSIKLNKKTASIKAGEKISLKLSGATGRVTWTTSNKTVATVTSAGVVTGKKAGSATITASHKGKKYICKITVKATEKQVINVKLDYLEDVLTAFLIKNTSSQTITIDGYMLVTNDYDDFLGVLIDEDTLENIENLTIAPGKTATVYFTPAHSYDKFSEEYDFFFTFKLGTVEYGCIVNGDGTVEKIYRTE